MNSLSEQISCPMCLEIPDNEVFLCQNGHNICGACSTSIVSCPQCRVPYGEVKVRNRTVEAIVQSLKVDCPNKSTRCPERLLPDSLDTHKESCEYSINNVKLCQHMGFNCAHKANAQNIASIIQHLQSEHGATTKTVTKFCMKLNAFPSHDTARVDKTWPPHVIELADSNIVITAHLKNDMLSCLGVILKESTVQQNQCTVEFQIKALANEAVNVVWQHPMLSFSEIVKRAAVLTGPVRMDYIQRYAISSDGPVSINVCIILPNGAKKHLIGAAAARTGVIAASLYDYVGDENRTLSMKMGDILQVIEKGTDGWCLCELHGNVGYVPLPLIDFRIQQKSGQKDVALLETKVQALCLHPYEAWNEKEITLKKGDVVRVISKDIYYGWWKCEFNGKTGLVPESKLTVVSNSDSSKSDTISANRRTNNIRWVKCKGGKHGNVQNSVLAYTLTTNQFAVRAGIPRLNFKVAGCLKRGDTTAMICFRNVAFRVPEYEILCIPGGYWKWSELKTWGKLIPDDSISTGLIPNGPELYVGYNGRFGSINASEGHFDKVTGTYDAVEKRTGYHFILAAKP